MQFFKKIMRTTITVDDDLLSSVMQISGAKSSTEAIRAALSGYVVQSRKQQVLALRGEVNVADNWRSVRQLEVAAPENRSKPKAATSKKVQRKPS